MRKQRVLRAPLIAVLAALPVLLVPAAAAHAHHVDSKAECVLVENQPTLKLTAHFIDFDETPEVNGRVLVDGLEKFNGVVPVVWGTSEDYDGIWESTYPATAGASHSVVTEWEWDEESDGEDHKTNPCPHPRTIGIDVEKNAVESTAVAGSTVNFTMSVKNTGNTSFVGYTFDDPNCAEQRTGANAADTTLDPGETWTYSCSMATQAGQTSASNTATATGTNSDGKSATDTDSASIPLTQPAAPATSVTPQGGSVPAGGVLPATILSGRARLRGPSGCVERVFRARVTGRSIARVRFFVDGELVKTVRGTRALYRLQVRPERFGFGRHRVVARVRFRAASGTPARTLALTFRRCRAQVVQPRFTG